MQPPNKMATAARTSIAAEGLGWGLGGAPSKGSSSSRVALLLRLIHTAMKMLLLMRLNTAWPPYLSHIAEGFDTRPGGLFR